MKYDGFLRAVEHIHGDVKRRWPIGFVNEIEIDEIDRLRQELGRAGLPKPSYTACVTKAIAMGVADLSPRFPELNSMIGHFLGMRWVSRFDHIAAGIAVSRDESGKDAIYVQVIPEPHKLTLAEITRRLAQASEAPAEELPAYRETQSLYKAPGWLQRIMLALGVNNSRLHAKHRGTFSLTTVGKFGVDIQSSLPQTVPIQYGFGKVKHRPVVRGGVVIPASTLFLSLSFDRRLMNGRPCAELLDRIGHTLNTADEGRWWQECGIAPVSPSPAETPRAA